MNKRKFWHILAYFSKKKKYGLIIVTVCIRNIYPVQTKSPKTSYWIRRLLVDFIYYQHFNTFKIVATSVPAILCRFTFDDISIRVIQERKKIVYAFITFRCNKKEASLQLECKISPAPGNYFTP